MSYLNALLAAIQFLTIIPVKTRSPITEKELGLSSLFYPVVGLIIATLLSILAVVVNEQPSSIQAAIILSVWVIITGGLHLDGLADTADAWLGGLGNKQRTLAIMKDPACGPIAVITLVLLLLLKFVMLQQVTEANLFNALLLACIIPRAALPWLMITTPYVRKQGIASSMIRSIPKNAALYSFGAISVILLLTGNILLLAFSLFVLLVLRYLMLRRLDGMTGDTAGASVEIIELCVLSFLVLLN
jgi:adenosylcobinamide-GDP ribazoletransferase